MPVPHPARRSHLLVAVPLLLVPSAGSTSSATNQEGGDADEGTAEAATGRDRRARATRVPRRDASAACGAVERKDQVPADRSWRASHAFPVANLDCWHSLGETDYHARPHAGRTGCLALQPRRRKRLSETCRKRRPGGERALLGYRRRHGVQGGSDAREFMRSRGKIVCSGLSYGQARRAPIVPSRAPSSEP